MHMKTEAFVSVEDYLKTSHDPDCDYVEGEVQERNAGERDHSKLQGEFFFFFRQRQAQWKTFAFIEQRIDDYLNFGVRYVWVIYPRSRRAWNYSKDGSREIFDGLLNTESPNFEIPLAEIFAALDAK